MSDVTNVHIGSSDATTGHARLVRTRDNATATSTTVSAPSGPATHTRTRAQKRSAPDEIERAVFAHIQAVRALGRTRINTADIALALGLPTKSVERAVAKLKDKGVKVIG